MAKSPLIRLHDGVDIPQLGLGVWKTPPEKTDLVVTAALEAGYRHIDTAAMYRNESGVGAALAKTPLKRDEIFVTTKLWNADQGHDQTLRAFDASMERLGLSVLDLYLIHWPVAKKGKFVETFKAMMALKDAGRVRSIGVSNFTPAHLTRLMDETGTVPSVNQVELHPKFQQRALRAFHDRHGIKTEVWSPLGRGSLLDDPVLVAIGAKHGKSSAQAIIRWHVQQGLIVFPKSENPARIAANIDVFDFELDDEDMARVAAMDDPNGRSGAHPDEADFV